MTATGPFCRYVRSRKWKVPLQWVLRALPGFLGVKKL